MHTDFPCSPKNNSPDSNHYAFPLDFMAIVDLIEMKVVKICHLPLGAEPITTHHTGPRKVRKIVRIYIVRLQTN
jgi:Cu2+-containing amine oxidase